MTHPGADGLVECLRGLSRALHGTPGCHRLAARVDDAIAASDADRQTFLQSNDLWGGSGSIADQAGVDSEPELRRAIEAALIRLGDEQRRLGMVNARTGMWVEAFAKWQRNGS